MDATSDLDRTSALDAVRENSTVLTAVRRAVRNSRLLAYDRDRWRDASRASSRAARTVAGWVRSSHVGHAVGTLAATFLAIAATSYVVRLARSTGQWVRASVLLRWFGTEPGSADVAVDLRKTRIGGPILAVIDACVRLLAAGRSASTSYGTATCAADHVRETPVRILSLLVLAAVAVTFSLDVVLGTHGPASVLTTTVLTVCCVVGLRSEATWAELRESAAVRSLVAALEPPVPPGGSSRDEPAADEDERTRQESE